MARTRGWKDWIPASGEGRALVEVKGRVGGKGAGMRRSTKGSRFSRLRRASNVKQKVIRAIPLAPGPFAANVIGQKDRTKNWDGHTGTSIRAEWLWAITPETMDYSGTDQTPLVIDRSDAEEEDDRYRVVGINGKLWWTPMVPLVTAATFETYAGFVGISFAKFDSGVFDSVSGKPVYPWANFTQATATTGIDKQGLTPHLSNTEPDAIAALLYQDKRWRPRVMYQHSKPWKIPTVYDSFQELIQPSGCTPVEIPLPRKLVCNIGRGEALGVCVWVKDFSQSSELGGSPVGRFDFHDVTIQLLKL